MQKEAGLWPPINRDVLVLGFNETRKWIKDLPKATSFKTYFLQKFPSHLYFVTKIYTQINNPSPGSNKTCKTNLNWNRKYLFVPILAKTVGPGCYWPNLKSRRSRCLKCPQVKLRRALLLCTIEWEWLENQPLRQSESADAFLFCF